MISAGDFRNGVTVEIDGNVCQIVFIPSPIKEYPLTDYRRVRDYE